MRMHAYVVVARRSRKRKPMYFILQCFPFALEGEVGGMEADGLAIVSAHDVTDSIVGLSPEQAADSLPNCLAR